MKKALMISLLTTTALGGALLFSEESEAATWIANAPESIQIGEGQQSYTLVLGDTLWAISQRTNLTVQTLADINKINLSIGEQYELPVGRVISFDGNKVTVKDTVGKVVSETIVTEDQKVNPNQNIGEPVNPSITESTTPEQGYVDNNGEVSPVVPGGNDNGGGGNVVNPTDPTNPEKPVDPEVPTEPEKPVEPEKVYKGEYIDGVNNGAVGTWTNKDEMTAYIEEHWAENTANGTWTDDYVMSTNGYGWIALFY